jgi:hypothetical protein
VLGSRRPARCAPPITEEPTVKKELSRRDLIGRAGLALGGLATIGLACGEESATPCEPQACPEPEVCPPASLVADFPYEKHLPAAFGLDAAAVRQAAYDGYYGGGGCGHGAYSALLGDLTRAGRPFTELPLRAAQFGAGGVAGYGSICGAVLGGAMIVSSLVESAGARNNLLASLMRWYEGFAFPAYAPTAVNAEEAGATKLLDWGTEPTKPAVTKVAPGSHLCHASVSGWCAAQDPVVPAGGASQPDKKARCARVTADVAGKVAELLNAYLASGALGARTFAVTAPGLDVTDCTSCHTGAVGSHGGVQAPPVASGMSCPTCHGDKAPSSHQALPSCTSCH